MMQGSTMCESSLEPQSHAAQVIVGEVTSSLCAGHQADGALRVTPSDLHIRPPQQVHLLPLLTREFIELFPEELGSFTVCVLYFGKIYV